MKPRDQLEIINFSTDRYVDAKTLSRIRSHAQQRVQDQRIARRTNIEDSEASGASAARTSRDVARDGGSGSQQSFTFMFEQQPGQHNASVGPTAIATSKRKKRLAKQNELLKSVKRESHSLSASPSERPDPFGAFPVAVDHVFLELTECYLHNWKWPHPKHVLYQQTLAHPVLVHSFLTILYKVCRADEYRCLFHENMTLGYISQGIQKLGTLDVHDRLALACALTWSIIRLATVKINEGQLETSINHLNALALISPDMRVWDNHMFGQHFQTATASLLLANFTQSSRVKTSLHLPFGPMEMPAILDVEKLGYVVPPSAILLDPIVLGFIQPEVADALLALTALYNTSTRIDSLPHTHTGPQAREGIKIALRLARCSEQGVLSNTWRIQFAECVRLTAILFTWSFGRNVDSQKNDSIASACRHNRAFLTSMLITCLLEEAKGSTAMYDFLLWVLIVCGSTTASIDDRAYFAGLIRMFFPDSKRWGVDHVRGLGKELPWIEIESGDERPQEAFWRSVVDPKAEVGVRKSAPLLLGYVGITPGLKERLEGGAQMEREYLMARDVEVPEA